MESELIDSIRIIINITSGPNSGFPTGIKFFADEFGPLLAIQTDGDLSTMFVSERN
jgi:hypothetical protein